MRGLVYMSIDGTDVAFREGMPLIEAAENAGIHIPHLCYLKGFEGIETCGMCLVEVAGSNEPISACRIKAREGMSIRTDTERIKERRKEALDLILSNHSLVCSTCPKEDACNLQKYAFALGLKESGHGSVQKDYSVDEANPFIRRDPNSCILCEKCVRICKAQATEVFSIQYEDDKKRITTSQDKPLHEASCTFCGSCLDACPVNALLEADRLSTAKDRDCEKVRSVCLSCGNACSISVFKEDGKVAKISSGSPEGAAERFLCAIGRFGFESLQSEMRLTVPMKKVGGELKETTWKDAIQIVADRLISTGSEASFISSGNITNEDAVMFKRLAAHVVKTGDYDSSVSLYADYDVMKSGGADLENADLFILAGTEPDQWKRVLPAVDAIIRKRMNEGAKLIVIHRSEPRIAQSATAFLKGSEVEMLKELSQALIAKGIRAPKKMVEDLAPIDPSDEAMDAADIFRVSKSPVIISLPSLYKAAVNLSLIKGKAVSVPLEANARGVVMTGLITEGRKFKEIVSSTSKLLYAVGEVPVSERPETNFLVVQNSHMTDIATQADLVLPSVHALESEGTVVDYLGRLKEVKKAVDPPGESRPHSEIFVDIAKAMGNPLTPASDSKIRNILDTMEKKTLSEFKKDKGYVVDAENFLEEIHRSTVNGSRILWLKELEKKSSD